MSGQRNRPTSLELMRRKVEANRIQGLAEILGSAPTPPSPSPPLTLQPSPAF
jgi:hypothetical protein